MYLQDASIAYGAFAVYVAKNETGTDIDQAWFVYEAIRIRTVHSLFDVYNSCFGELLASHAALLHLATRQKQTFVVQE